MTTTEKKQLHEVIADIREARDGYEHAMRLYRGAVVAIRDTLEPLLMLPPPVLSHEVRRAVGEAYGIANAISEIMGMTSDEEEARKKTGPGADPARETPGPI